MVALLAGDPATASLPATVPFKLAGIIRQAALSDPAGGAGPDAWALREELGQIANEIFGPPRFVPLVMPPSSSVAP